LAHGRSWITARRRRSWVPRSAEILETWHLVLGTIVILESQALGLYSTRGEKPRTGRGFYDANLGLLVGTTLSPGQRKVLIGRGGRG
jgi:hypothetical protein